MADLVWTEGQRRQINDWLKQWNQDGALINPNWHAETPPTFSVLQYPALTEDQLRTKLGQFPRGTRLVWQFWQPGQIFLPVSMEKQEAAYDAIRALAEEHGISIEKANHP